MKGTINSCQPVGRNYPGCSPAPAPFHSITNSQEPGRGNWFLGHSKGPAQQQDLSLILVPGTVLCSEKSFKDIGQQKRLPLCCCLPSLAEFLTPCGTLLPSNENECKPCRQLLLPQTQLLIPHREPRPPPAPQAKSRANASVQPAIYKLHSGLCSG